jgi:hypothetical protein
LTPGHKCGDYERKNFYNNTAHSIDGSKSGLGAWIYPDPQYPSQTSECMEGSFFNAYKTKMSGVFMMNTAKHVIFSKMTMIDNGFGITAQP